jgi:hypothetical protein
MPSIAQRFQLGLQFQCLSNVKHQDAEDESKAPM